MTTQAVRPGVRAGRWIIGALMPLFMVPAPAGAASVLNVWNGPNQTVDDTNFLSVDSVAIQLSFASLNLLADNEVRYLENVDLSESVYGPTTGNLTNITPMTGIYGDIIMGSGAFAVRSPLLELSGSVYSHDGTLLDAARLMWCPQPLSCVTSNVVDVNVLSNAASLQQAIDFTQDSAGLSTVNAVFGFADSLAFEYDTRMILSGGLLSGAVAMNHLDALLELHGYAFELDLGTGYVPFGSGSIGAAAGSLRGYLDSGDAFTIDFTQASTGQIMTYDSAPLSAVPLPAAAWLFLSGLLGLAGLARRNRHS
ncbi:MAG TPA: VPLPA-CTERM sorting domain-containing protein [Gammaproteobacteria bacterium]|nr:VPLPA-CTERM sorting domain-containing protein [Gammaproteobacteria bacterium]